MSSFTDSLVVAGADPLLGGLVPNHVGSAVAQLHPGPTVLVVDDDQPDRIAVTRMVRGLGYQARSCRRGQDALRFMQKHPRVVRVLVADMGMAGMDGGELVERALDADPNLRAILMADLGDRGTAELLPGYRDLPILRKPIRFPDLYGSLVALVGPPRHSAVPASMNVSSQRSRRRPSGHHEA
jgi:CheY-like chemotaxis protein